MRSTILKSTLARPGPARPITVLLVLLALDGAMAQDRWDRIACYDSNCLNDHCSPDSEPGFVQRPVANCNGYAFIETVEQCAAAAEALGLFGPSQGRSLGRGYTNFRLPHGCYFKQSTGTIHFNTDGDRNYVDDGVTDTNSLCSRGRCSTSEFSSSTSSCACGAQSFESYIGSCCDPKLGLNTSLNPARSIVTCTEYPEGRVGPLWNGRIVCLSHKQGGSPKTAAGCAGLSDGDTCQPFAPSGDAGSGNDGGTCREQLSTSGSACASGDACYAYPYLRCLDSVVSAGSGVTCPETSSYVGGEDIPDGCSCFDQGLSSGCQDGSSCCSLDGAVSDDNPHPDFCMPAALFPKEGECQDTGALIGFIVGMCCLVCCCIGIGTVIYFSASSGKGVQAGVYLPGDQKQPGAYYGEEAGGLAAAAF